MTDHQILICWNQSKLRTRDSLTKCSQRVISHNILSTPVMYPYSYTFQTILLLSCKKINIYKPSFDMFKEVNPSLRQNTTTRFWIKSSNGGVGTQYCRHGPMQQKLDNYTKCSQYITEQILHFSNFSADLYHVINILHISIHDNNACQIKFIRTQTKLSKLIIIRMNCLKLLLLSLAPVEGMEGFAFYLSGAETGIILAMGSANKRRRY